MSNKSKLHEDKDCWTTCLFLCFGCGWTSAVTAVSSPNESACSWQDLINGAVSTAVLSFSIPLFARTRYSGIWLECHDDQTIILCFGCNPLHAIQVVAQFRPGRQIDKISTTYFVPLIGVQLLLIPIPIPICIDSYDTVHLCGAEWYCPRFCQLSTIHAFIRK